MATQSQQPAPMPSYGPPPMSLPTPSYDEPPLQSGNNGSSYKPLPSGGPDPAAAYKPPSQNPNMEVTPYRPALPPSQPSIGPDPSKWPAPTSANEYEAAAYNRPPLPPSGLSYGGLPPVTSSFQPGGGGPPVNTTAPSFPPPPNAQQQLPHVGSTEQMPGPAAHGMMSTSQTSLPLATTTTAKGGIKDTRTTTEFALREYMSLQRARRTAQSSKGETGIDERLRIQASTVLGDLQTLRQEVADFVKDAESHRWRRFLIGGAIASFIPLVKKLFPRSSRHPEESPASNDTEYAFRKSKSLISRILDATRRPGIATVAFFVFAVLYVFQNEVSLRVARTVSKRLKRLSSKVERGEEEIDEVDLKMLQGWRWRVLMWSE